MCLPFSSVLYAMFERSGPSVLAREKKKKQSKRGGYPKISCRVFRGKDALNNHATILGTFISCALECATYRRCRRG